MAAMMLVLINFNNGCVHCYDYFIMIIIIAAIFTTIQMVIIGIANYVDEAGC